MGVAVPPPSPPLLPHHLTIHHHHHPKLASRPLDGADPTASSMSQGFHQGNIYSFSDGVDRSLYASDQQQHIAQQSRREKLRVQGFDHPPLVPAEEREEQIYEPPGGGNMLSDMFNFPSAGGPSATELLANQIPANYRLQRPPAMAAAAPGFSGDWYGVGSRQGVAVVGGGSLNGDSAAAMQLFLMNPPQQQQQQQRRRQQPERSPSPPSPAPTTLQQPQAFLQTPFFASSAAFGGGGAVEGQGLSLTLSTSLQQLEMAKAEELRVRDAVQLYYGNQQQQQQPPPPPPPPPLQLQGQPAQVGHQVLHHVGYGGSATGVVNVLRQSRYARAAQELLEEFCSVVRGQLKGATGKGRRPGSSTNPNPGSCDAGGASTSAAVAGPSSSSTTKEPPPLSAADRFEQQRRKAKLLSMLDEVDRRYSHYCDQMQMVVNSFDSAMGFGAAAPYTALAQKAMSRHFRCLKDTIAAQLKQTCELLGEKDGGSTSGITKGETPRLRLLEQSLWRQRAFHQMGMMEQEAWRPQRGLPERSVKILRAWLFEHFLHPYPSDADKHLLARQTGLSRNQVSNWFINARVRLWKPMVEDMYQQEAKEEGETTEREEGRVQSPTQLQQQQQHHHHHHQKQHHPHQQHQQHQQPQLQRRPEINATKGAPSQIPLPSPVSGHQQQHGFAPSEGAPALPPPRQPAGAGNGDVAALLAMDALPTSELGVDDIRGEIVSGYSAAAMAGSMGARGRLGASGDVSLTLGLRHAGNMPEKGRFSVRDFEGC